ncbi:hypothetical protein ACFYUK_18705 [Nonomuraea wenchangensis]
MLRTKRAVIASVTITVLGWIAAGANTIFVIRNPHLHYAPVSLLWLHSFALVATIMTMMLLATRAFHRMIGETVQAYAVGLETGIEIRDSMPAPSSFAPAAEMKEAPAVAGACRG